MGDLYLGYHGTNGTNVAAIKTSNFHISRRADEWIGHGVYFFLDGISCPITRAREWVQYKAHLGELTTYAILETVVEAEKVLDLRTQEGLVAFERVRQKLLDKAAEAVSASEMRKELGKSFAIRSATKSDCKLFNEISNLMDLDGSIHNLYIKTTEQKKYQISSHVPNSTVMSVRKPEKCIDIGAIEVIEEGNFS